MNPRHSPPSKVPQAPPLLTRRVTPLIGWAVLSSFSYFEIAPGAKLSQCCFGFTGYELLENVTQVREHRSQGFTKCGSTGTSSLQQFWRLMGHSHGRAGEAGEADVGGNAERVDSVSPQKPIATEVSWLLRHPSSVLQYPWGLGKPLQQHQSTGNSSTSVASAFRPARTSSAATVNLRLPF